MRISVEFQFNQGDKPAAITGVEGEVTDIILPCVGDLIRHSQSGNPFTGKVTERVFTYAVSEGFDVSGSVTVTLLMERVLIQ